ncbi:type VI secretion system Vgr family protein [Candidatus Hepatobacter penaei]|uniref:type VI secretion system Vgr family protein n=1 Tax=Candidatus Hepatobacter penaei TaxID=1274402 RepID=UPI0004F333BE|nr:type VI secretion system tip protein TssI/VgrG [Candidatus Hepatobacter penaei]
MARIEGEDFLSAPFSFDVTLRIKEDKEIPENLVGKPAMVEILSGKDGKTPKDHERYFHGLIAGVRELSHLLTKEKKAYREVVLTLRPHFWFLSLTKDSQTFVEKKPIDIVSDLLKYHKIDFKNEAKSSGDVKRAFCVQYNESDFHFISRLLEESGIGYYFTYEKTKHQMVLFDKNDAGAKFEGDLVFSKMSSSEGREIDRLWLFEKHHAPVVSEFSANDYFFEKPTQDLHKKAPGKIKSALKLLFYDHLCGFNQKSESETDAEELVKQHIERKEWRAFQCHGRSTYASLSAGAKIKTKACPNKLDGDYFVISVKHAYGVRDDTMDYENTFSCVPQDRPYRPLCVHKRPRIWGFITAKVTGKGEEEVWADPYGAIKIKFFWDWRAEDNEKSSCWVRVASGSANVHWGIVNTPRVGQEVLVQFEEGDPEKPIVVGCVFNGIHVPPYGDKDEIYKDKMYKDRSKGKVRSIWKTRSIKGDNKTFNEICLTDDEKKEEIFIQAQKDYRTLVKDQKITVIKKGNQETTLESGDRKVTIEGKQEDGSKAKGDDTLTLLKGSRTVEIKEGDVTTTLDKGKETHTLKEGDQTITLSKGKRSVTIESDDTLTINGKWTVKVKGDLSFDVSGNIDMKADKDFSVKCNNFKLETTIDTTIDAGKNANINAKMNATVAAKMALTMEGEMKASLKGAMVDVNGSAMSTVKGGMVMIN